MSFPLKNKLFVSTRPQGQSDELNRLLAEAGAEMVEMPLIKIQPARLSEQEKQVFNRLEDFQWLVFTSTNGVRYFFENLKVAGGNKKLPGSLRIAVIGNKTEKTLNRLGYKASFVNPGIIAEDFAEAFIQNLKNEKEKPDILLALGNLARTIIQDQLSDYARCTRLNVYQTVAPETVDEKILQDVKNNRYDMLIFTSPSGIHNFMERKGDMPPGKIRAACIGEITAQAANETGINPLVVAHSASAKGIVESIIHFYK